MTERIFNIVFGKTIYSGDIFPKSFTWEAFIRHISDFKNMYIDLDTYKNLSNSEQQKAKDTGFFYIWFIQ